MSKVENGSVAPSVVVEEQLLGKADEGNADKVYRNRIPEKWGVVKRKQALGIFRLLCVFMTGLLSFCHHLGSKAQHGIHNF